MKVVTIPLAYALSTHAMSTEATCDASKSRPLSISLGVYIRSHSELLLLGVLVRNHWGLKALVASTSFR